MPTLRGLRELETAPGEDAAGESRRAGLEPLARSGVLGRPGAGRRRVSCWRLTNLYYYTGRSVFTEDRSDEVIAGEPR